MTALNFIADLADLLMWGAVVAGIIVTIAAYWLEALADKAEAGGLWNLLFSHLCDMFYFISRVVWGLVVGCAVINVIMIILVYMNGRIYG